MKSLIALACLCVGYCVGEYRGRQMASVESFEIGYDTGWRNGLDDVDAMHDYLVNKP